MISTSWLVTEQLVKTNLEDEMLRQALRKTYWATLKVSPKLMMAHLSYLRAHERWPNLANPCRFTEKVFAAKLWGDHDTFTRLADKVQVKDHVASLIGSSFVIPTLWHGSCLPPREERNWPLPFVLKANHGSRMNALVRKQDKLDWDALEAQAEAWLRTDWPTWQCEDWYNRIERQLLVEPMLGDGDTDLPDYKVMVFAGQAQFIQVDTDRWGDHRRTFFDRNWVPQSFQMNYPLNEKPHPRPRHLSQILEAAEALGQSFEFVRVDFYDLPEGPKFGEMTFSPGCGLEGFVPNHHDLEWGQLWVGSQAADNPRKRRAGGGYELRA